MKNAWKRIFFYCLVVVFFWTPMTRQWIQKIITRYRAPCPSCSVIVIAIDPLRADALPCFGYNRNTAPNLCAFASEHVSFTNAYSQISWTLPSVLSLMTSLYPSQHGFIVTLRDSLSPQVVTLPQVLQANGYDTMYVGLTDGPHLPLTKGLGKGFGDIVAGENPSDWKPAYKKLQENIRKNKPTFIFLHTYYVHAPYLTGRDGKRMFTTDSYPAIALTNEEFSRPSYFLWQFVLADTKASIDGTYMSQTRQAYEDRYKRLKAAKNLNEFNEVFKTFAPWEQKNYLTIPYLNSINTKDPRQVAYLRALYDEKIYQLDQELAPLFTLLSDPQIKKNTIVVILSDHGDEFMEHGSLEHFHNLYNTTTHVPLILSIPGIKKEQFDDLVQSIDVFPTILGLVGIQNPVQLTGIDLTARITEKSQFARNMYLLGEFGRDFSLRSIRDQRWKLYLSQQTSGSASQQKELYDLVLDPNEQHEVSDLHPDVVARLSRALESAVTNNMRF